MPVRKTPWSGAAQGGQQIPGMDAGMAMPGMSGASPAGNNRPQTMTPMGGGDPSMQNPLMPQGPMGPMAPNANADPMNPFSIDKMLQTNRPPDFQGGVEGAMAPPAVGAGQAQRKPLMPYGDAHGTPPSDYGQPAGEGAADPMQAGAPQAPDMGSIGSSGMSPMVMLRLLKTLGKI